MHVGSMKNNFHKPMLFMSPLSFSMMDVNSLEKSVHAEGGTQVMTDFLTRKISSRLGIDSYKKITTVTHKQLFIKVHVHAQKSP